MTLYHITMPTNWRETQESRTPLYAKQDKTGVWGVFMFDKRNFMEAWEHEADRLISSFPYGPLVLLEILVKQDILKDMKVRNITAMRDVIHRLVSEGQISGYFVSIITDISLQLGEHDDLYGISAAGLLPKWVDWYPVEYFNYDKIPFEDLRFLGQFEGKRELFNLLHQDQ